MAQPPRMNPPSTPAISAPYSELGATPRAARSAMRDALAELSAHAEGEAERWICRATGWSRARLYTALDSHHPVAVDRDEWQRRLDGEPLAYIWGEEEFFGLTLQVTPQVLIPRPDTELVVERALSHLEARKAQTPARVLDLGTGSGAIALAIKHSRPETDVTATDASAAALEVAQANATRLGLALTTLKGSWFDLLPADARWDLILSNPPYIDPADSHLADLRHEPRQALTAPEQGLGDLQQIIGNAARHLATDGVLIVEHGHDQGAAVRNLFATAGFSAIVTTRDYGGNERTTEGVRS